MARQKLRAGELGAIQVMELPSGRFQARARLCDEVGKVHQLKASGTTAALAETALREKADAVLNDSGGPRLSKDATITEAAVVFLYDKGRSGTVEDSTLEAYEASVRNVITPTCGDLLLRDFTVRRCNRILADIREQRSLAAARKARSVLSLICQTGIEYDILAFNPVRDARRLPLPEKKTSVLTPEQLLLVQRIIRAWRKDSGYGPRPNVTTLENAMWIMVGTSVRVGEVLALRRCDVDVASNPPSALVDATMKQTKTNGPIGSRRRSGLGRSGGSRCRASPQQPCAASSPEPAKERRRTCSRRRAGSRSASATTNASCAPSWTTIRRRWTRRGSRRSSSARTSSAALPRRSWKPSPGSRWHPGCSVMRMSRSPARATSSVRSWLIR